MEKKYKDCRFNTCYNCPFVDICYKMNLLKKD